MVGATSGAGSSLVIRGTIDTSDIERGFARIEVGFDSIKGKGQSFESDLTRMSLAARRLSKGLGNIATIGVTAMVGLAKSAPAVAPAMARIGVQFDRLQRTLGRALRPEFDKFASGFEKFVNFADAHPDLLSGLALTAGSIAGVKALGLLFGVTVAPSVITALTLMGAGVGIAAGLEQTTNQIRERLTGGQDQTLNLPVTQTLENAPFFTGGSIFSKFVEPLELFVSDFQSKRKTLENLNNQINQNEEDRKFNLLNFWDNVFG